MQSTGYKDLRKLRRNWKGWCSNARPAEVERLLPLDQKDKGRERAWTVEALEAICTDQPPQAEGREENDGEWIWRSKHRIFSKNEH